MRVLSNAAIVVKGRGTGYLIFIFVISTLAVAMPLWLTATGHALDRQNLFRIWGVVALLDLVFCFFALYCFSRRLAFDGERIYLWSWFHDRSWPISSVTQISMQQDVADGANDTATVQNYLALWSNSELLTRINLFGLPRPQLAQFLSALPAKNPRLILAPEVMQLAA